MAKALEITPPPPIAVKHIEHDMDLKNVFETHRLVVDPLEEVESDLAFVLHPELLSYRYNLRNRQRHLF